MKTEKAEELMKRCPACLNLFPAGVGQMQDGFMACAQCGAEYGEAIAAQQKSPRSGKQVSDKKRGCVDPIIKEIYATIAELTISVDKDTQSRGKELRKLMEQLQTELAKDKEAVG